MNMNDINDPNHYAQFLGFINTGNEEKILKMLKRARIVPSAEDNRAIKEAIATGNKRIVEILLNVFSIADTVDYNQLKKLTKDKEIIEIIDNTLTNQKLFDELLVSIENSDIENIAKIVGENKSFDPSMYNNRALLKASKADEVEILDFLLYNPIVASKLTSSDYYDIGHVDEKNRDMHRMINKIREYNLENPERVKELKDFKEGKLTIPTRKIKNFIDYVQEGNIKVIEKKLKQGFDPSIEDNKAIKKAVELSNERIIRLLLDDPRVSNTVNYDELIKIALEKHYNKSIATLIGDIARKNKKLLQTGRRSSIPEYKTIRKILTRNELKPEIEFGNFEKELKNVDIDKVDKNVYFKIDIEFPLTITEVKKNDSVIDSKYFKSFLCEMETFKWTANEQSEDYLTHGKRKDVAFNTIYPTYTKHLVKMLGNNMTLFTIKRFTDQFDELPSDTLSIRADTLSNIITEPNYHKLQNRIFNFPKVIEQYYYMPLYFKEFQTYTKFLYTCQYSEEIKRKNTRYSLLNCMYVYSIDQYTNISHYTFLFIDHDEKIVEYYDPEVIGNKKSAILFTYKALQTIFPEYKINNFWRTSSIQKTEQYEKDEGGFCVKWGHMILHLKLLNINMDVGTIEELLIQECETKKLSLYELVLNYTYLMKRIITSKNTNKII